MYKVCCLILVILIIGGCGAYINIHSEVDIQHEFPETCKVYLLLAKDATLVEKNFYYTLKEELGNKPFQLIDSYDSADYVIQFGVNTSILQRSFYLPIPSKTETEGTVRYNGITTASYSEETKNTTWLKFNATQYENVIWLSLHQTSDISECIITPVWYVQAETKRSILYKHVQDCAQWLLASYGKALTGSIPIKKSNIHKDEFLKRYEQKGVIFPLGFE